MANYCELKVKYFNASFQWSLRHVDFEQAYYLVKEIFHD
jgi:hypothetical protein